MQYRGKIYLPHGNQNEALDETVIIDLENVYVIEDTENPCQTT